jgi:hypothetical protein
MIEIKHKIKETKEMQKIKKTKIKLRKERAELKTCFE